MYDCVSSYQAISGRGIFSQQGLIFLENDKNWFSFVFTVFLRHIKIKSPLKYKSVYGRVVEPSGHSTALSSCNRIITGSCLRRCSIHPSFFFSKFWMNVLSPSVSLLIIIFHYIILCFFLFSLIWVLLEKFFYS